MPLVILTPPSYPQLDPLPSPSEPPANVNRTNKLILPYLKKPYPYQHARTPNMNNVEKLHDIAKS
ncbi:hypothetical protein AN958_01623 [Leucoagaricus sp. SymC.cos]|nr:hypothetical protein AN958_01623 [Leucoagaricus sp. SymC.cos]